MDIARGRRNYHHRQWWQKHSYATGKSNCMSEERKKFLKKLWEELDQESLRKARKRLRKKGSAFFRSVRVLMQL